MADHRPGVSAFAPSRQASTLHLSGVLVVTDPERLDACGRELEALPGVEVHHADRQSGRLIAVVESDGPEGQERGLRRIQALPAVRMAALVEYRTAAAAGSDEEEVSP